MYRIWSFFTQRQNFSYLLLVALILVGIFSIFTIPKESAPEVQIPVAIVTTSFPGASASDVETLVTDPIEEELDSGLSNVSSITSTSREGVSNITVEFNANADIDSSIREVRDEVDAITDLPEDANDPQVSEVNFENQPIMLTSVSSRLPLSDFITLAEDVESQIERVAGVSLVEVSGIPERTTQVIVEKEKLPTYGVTISQITNAISTANSATPAGSLEINGTSYALRFAGDITNTEQLRNIPVAAIGGIPVYVKDLAFVSDGLSEQKTVSRLNTGGEEAQQAVTYSIFKSSGADITQVTKDVEERLNELQKTILAEANVKTTFNSGDFVRQDLRRLSFTGLQTILLVTIILFIALGWREALIAGLSVPAAFLIAFIGLEATGNTINFVSLFSLILAVGIMVDTAIVITEGIHTRVKAGKERIKSALATIKEFHTPLTSGTMTTVAVFFPLFFISGVTGKFIASIPFTVITVLLASLFVSLAFVPLFSAKFLRAESEEKSWLEKKREKLNARFQSWYRHLLDNFLKDWRLQNTAMMGLVLSLIIALMLPAVGVMNVIFFPQESQDFLYANVTFPAGTTLTETNERIQKVEDIYQKDTRIESFVTTVGSLSAFSQNGGSGSQHANTTLLLSGEGAEQSGAVRSDIENHVKAEISSSAKVEVSEPASGPPTGTPIQISFIGEDLSTLASISSEAEGILANIDGAINTDTSLNQEGVDLLMQPDRDAIARVGLDARSVAQTLRASVSGVTATTIRNAEKDRDVVVRLGLNSDYSSLSDIDNATVEDIKSIPLSTPNGTVLLGSLLDSSVQASNAVINHKNLNRVVDVTAQLGEGAVAQNVVQQFRAQMQEVEIPDGVQMQIGGESEDINQSFRDMLFALLYGVLLISAILILQFNSFRDMFYIIGIIPFLLVGILVGLTLTGQPLSFPSIMGFIALSGIVVNNSIILIDTINTRRREHPEKSLRENVMEGATTRLRPVTLTILTTIIGVIPLTYASALWGPLAFAIIFGLSFSIILTLLFVPMIYYRWPRDI